jgi:hypothetical protein
MTIKQLSVLKVSQANAQYGTVPRWEESRDLKNCYTVDLGDMSYLISAKSWTCASNKILQSLALFCSILLYSELNRSQYWGTML